MKLEIQIIDTRNCQPIPDVYLEVYHCNATGVYSGVQAQGNGNADDASNLDATFGRGIQQTDSNGYVYALLNKKNIPHRSQFPPFSRSQRSKRYWTNPRTHKSTA